MFIFIVLEMHLTALKCIIDLLNDPDLQRKIYVRDQSMRSQLEKLTQNENAESILKKVVEALEREKCIILFFLDLVVMI